MTIPFTPLQGGASTASTSSLGSQAPMHAYNRALKVWAFSRSGKGETLSPLGEELEATGGGE